MTAARRTRWSFAFDLAVDWARELNRPLVVLEALGCRHRWANLRSHAFVLQGMADNRERLREAPVAYYPYVEPEAGAGRGLLEALAGPACLVVTDDAPHFFLPRVREVAARKLPVPLVAVDGNGLLPLSATTRTFTTAASFRRFLQRSLPEHLPARPRRDPVGRRQLRDASLPREILRRWPAAPAALLRCEPRALARLPVDDRVGPVTLPGGARAAGRRLREFLAGGLDRYGEDRNHPDRDAASGLSPYLHFGHISVHEIFDALARHEGWGPDRLLGSVTGGRNGWWGMSEPAESFLDELVTWRELALNGSHTDVLHGRYESLPTWARTTLEAHAADPRPHLYTRTELEEARTHDPIWNAAQTQLRREGRMHNYLRMLWGKKILEWSPTPRDALEHMIELNNRWALDGRDPNSYAGIFWVLGRYDRAWGPERPIFGKVRYMSSDATRRKLALKDYLQRYG